MFMLNIYRSIIIVFLSIFILLVQTTTLAFANEYRIISVEQDYDSGNAETKSLTVTDFYINAGQKNGIQKGMLFDVYRPKLIIDSLDGKKQKIRILVGKVNVVDVFNDISVARIDSLELLSTNPVVNYRTVMIGDYLKPSSAPSKKESAYKARSKSKPVIPEESASKAHSETKIVIPGNILFDYNSWKLKPEASGALKKVAELIESSDNVLFVEGHTCNRGTKDYNLRLSRKRAESAATYLRTLKNIPGKRIITIGYGEDIPIAPNKTEKGRAKNRRIEFKIIPANQVSFIK